MCAARSTPVVAVIPGPRAAFRNDSRWLAPAANAINVGEATAGLRMDAPIVDIKVEVNGEAIAARVEPRQTLVDFLREELGLTGTHVGCEHGVCGACTVRLDGEVVRGCLVFAVQCDGSRVETIEGLSDSGAIADLQLAFQQRNALQCGYCTPGVLISAQELLASSGIPSRDTIREHVSGHYCRCTGYQAIVDAIESTARARAGDAG
jgi:aerobic carbon-monoxide dehydrogenase small subunit